MWYSREFVCFRCQIVSCSDNSASARREIRCVTITGERVYNTQLGKRTDRRRFGRPVGYINGLPSQGGIQFREWAAGPGWITAARYLRGLALLRSQKVLEGRLARLD